MVNIRLLENAKSGLEAYKWLNPYKEKTSMNKILKKIIIIFLLVGNVCFSQTIDLTPHSQNNENINSLDNQKVAELICPNNFSNPFSNTKKTVSPQQCMSEFANYHRIKFTDLYNEFWVNQKINGCLFLAEPFLKPTSSDSATSELSKYSSKLTYCSISTGNETDCIKVWNAFLKSYDEMKTFNLKLQNLYRGERNLDGKLCAVKLESLFSNYDNKSVEQYTNIVLPEQIKSEMEIIKKDESERLQRIYAENERLRKEKETFQNKKNQEASQKSPDSVLQEKYVFYMFTRDCYEIRKDFRVQYINLNTFNQIKNSIKNFENEFKRKNPKINTNEKWLLAEKQYMATTFTLIDIHRLNPNTFLSDMNILCNATAFELNAVSNSTIQKKDF